MTVTTADSCRSSEEEFCPQWHKNFPNKVPKVMHIHNKFPKVMNIFYHEKEMRGWL